MGTVSDSELLPLLLLLLLSEESSELEEAEELLDAELELLVTSALRAEISDGSIDVVDYGGGDHVEKVLKK